MKNVSTAFLAAIQGSHTIVSYVDVLNRGAVVVANVPVSEGEVTLDATAEIRGRCDLTIASEALVPLLPTDTLAPYGNEVRVKRGVRYGDGTEELVSLGVFRIDETPVKDPGRSVKITGYDRSIIVREARLEAPHITAAGTEWTYAMAQVVNEAGWWSGAYPLSTVISPTASGTPLIVAPEQGDRWALINDWARAIGYEVFFNGDGSFVARLVPNYDRASPVWTVNTGSTGTLISAVRKWRRDGIFNRVIAIGETPTGVYRGVATDNDPASPTYYYGSFGKVPRWFTSPLMTSALQCQAAADSLLRKSLGQSSEVTFEALCNPALEPGDLIQVQHAALGINANFIVDVVKTPLNADGQQNLKVRAA